MLSGIFLYVLCSFSPFAYVSGEIIPYYSNAKKDAAYFSAGIKGTLKLYNNLTAYEDISLYKSFETDMLTYRDYLYHPMYHLYSFDKQPVITQHDIFDVRLEHAYIMLNKNHLSVLTGRDTLNWPGDLLFSGYHIPYNFIYRAKFKKGGLLFETFHAIPMDTFEFKRICGHRLQIHYLSVDFVLEEGVSSAEKDFFKYINPIAPFYIIQRRGMSNSDNLLGLVGIMHKNFSVFFLDDDFIVDKGGTSKYGIKLQLKYGPVKFWSVAIPRYTYTHVTDTNAWSLAGSPIGYRYGNDLLDFYCTYKKNWAKGELELTGIVLNHGTGTLDEHWENSGNPRNPRFPGGIVQRIYGIHTSFTRNNNTISMFLHRIHNYRNIEGNNFYEIGVWLKFYAEQRINIIKD